MATDRETITAELRRATLPYCILAVLDRTPTYGYDLVRELAEEVGLEASEGTVYPLLSKLQKQRLISARWQPSDAGPPRKYYSLTDRGDAVLRAFTAAWSDTVSSTDAVLGVVR